jgi:hypothetical protein
MTFSDACALVASEPEVREIYPADDFEVASYGWEDATRFLVVAGTHKDVTGEGDYRSLTLDAPSFYVDKSTGDVNVVYGMEGSASDGMIPVGDTAA